MKKHSYLVAIVCMVISCNEKKAESTNTVATRATDSVSTVSKTEKSKPVYVYPVKYSEWEIGNPDNIKTVLDCYKAWDNQDANKVAGFFADTVRLRIPTERNEIVIANNKINEALGKNRNLYNTTSNDIISAVSLHDKESGEDWVLITTYNKWIEKDGKRDSILYNDNWVVKGGKLTMLTSFHKVPTAQFLKNEDPKK